MGWCSGTEIFDVVCQSLLENDGGKPKTKKEILTELIIALEKQDWDCQNESSFFEHRLVNEIMHELHPDWFEVAILNKTANNEKS